MNFIPLFLGVMETIVVVWVLFSLFSVFCITLFGDCTCLQHREKNAFLMGDNYTCEINQVSSENHGRAVSILIVPWENCGCTEVPMAGKNSCSQSSPNFIWQHILFQLVFGFLLSAFFLNPFFVLGTLNFFFFFFSLVVCLVSLFSVSCFGSEVLFTFSF